MRGWAAISRAATAMSTGTAALNTPPGRERSRMAPASTARSEAEPELEHPVAAGRPARPVGHDPLTLPGTRPTVLDTLASTGG